MYITTCFLPIFLFSLNKTPSLNHARVYEPSCFQQQHSLPRMVVQHVLSLVGEYKVPYTQWVYDSVENNNKKMGRE